MTRHRSLLCLLACLVAIAGCGSSRHVSATSDATRHATTTTSHTELSAASQKFAAAYIRFLAGGGTASALPDTAASVRALAAQTGPIPAARRRGSLVLSHLRPAQGQSGSYLLAARNDTNTFFAQITLGEQHGRWVVVQLTTPDFVQSFAAAGPRPPIAPHGSAAAKNTAARFLQAYLPWLYDHGPLRAVQDTAPRLLARLKRHPPRVPPTMQSLKPKVAVIAMQRHRKGWQALPNITDGQETYELVLTITRARDRWLVTNVSSPR